MGSEMCIRDRHVDQFGTLVHPDHRGHRLGMAVKCAQLRLLAEEFPDRDYIQTSNAEVNAHMVAINVALGFEIHQVWGEFEKRLGAAQRRWSSSTSQPSS